MSLAQIAPTKKMIARVHGLGLDLDEALRDVHDELRAQDTPAAREIARLLLERCGPLVRAIIVETATAGS